MSARFSDPPFNATADQAVPADTTPVAATSAVSVVAPMDSPWVGIPLAEIPEHLVKRIFIRIALALGKGGTFPEAAELAYLRPDELAALIEAHPDQWQSSRTLITQLNRYSDEGKARVHLRNLVDHEDVNVSLKAAIRLHTSGDVFRHWELKKYELELKYPDGVPTRGNRTTSDGARPTGPTGPTGAAGSTVSSPRTRSAVPDMSVRTPEYLKDHPDNPNRRFPQETPAPTPAPSPTLPASPTQSPTATPEDEQERRRRRLVDAMKVLVAKGWQPPDDPNAQPGTSVDPQKAVDKFIAEQRALVTPILDSAVKDLELEVVPAGESIEYDPAEVDVDPEAPPLPGMYTGWDEWTPYWKAKLARENAYVDRQYQLLRSLISPMLVLAGWTPPAKNPADTQQPNHTTNSHDPTAPTASAVSAPPHGPGLQVSSGTDPPRLVI